MEYRRGELVYEGKAKRLYRIEGRPEWLLQEFKDSLTAFNARKKGEFEGKGRINRDITSLVFRFLEAKGVAGHRVADLGLNEMITEKLDMLKLEVVVRNILAGSTAQKFGIEEGTPLERPLTEFYYKEDVLNDPFISDEQALMLKVVNDPAELDELKRLALKVNDALLEFFETVGLKLVDFKMEFGRNAAGAIVLADEITPDSCRLWDKTTGERMDKDRFRRDLGNVKESYVQVFERVRDHWETRL